MADDNHPPSRHGGESGGDKVWSPGVRDENPRTQKRINRSATKTIEGEGRDGSSLPFPLDLTVDMTKGLGEAGFNAAKGTATWPAKAMKSGWDSVSEEAKERIAERREQAEERASGEDRDLVGDRIAGFLGDDDTVEERENPNSR